jgi:hypothetical protein
MFMSPTPVSESNGGIFSKLGYWWNGGAKERGASKTLNDMAYTGVLAGLGYMLFRATPLLVPAAPFLIGAVALIALAPVFRGKSEPAKVIPPAGDNEPPAAPTVAQQQQVPQGAQQQTGNDPQQAAQQTQQEAEAEAA